MGHLRPGPETAHPNISMEAITSRILPTKLFTIYAPRQATVSGNAAGRVCDGADAAVTLPDGPAKEAVMDIRRFAHPVSRWLTARPAPDGATLYAAPAKRL